MSKDRSPWIELHLSVVGHRKTWLLADALNIDRVTALGHICSLWLWAVELAQDGDLSAFPDRAIAEAGGWRKAPHRFVDALIAAGYLDADKTLHEWGLYAGPLLEKRRRDRVRKRAIPQDFPRISGGDSDGAQHGGSASPSTVNRQPSTSPTQSDSARTARDWFVLAMEHEPDAMQVEMLLNLDVAHPPECIRWAFEKSVGADNRWLYAKGVLDRCLTESHGPKAKPAFKARDEHRRQTDAEAQLAAFKAAGGSV